MPQPLDDDTPITDFRRFDQSIMEELDSLCDKFLPGLLLLEMNIRDRRVRSLEVTNLTLEPLWPHIEGAYRLRLVRKALHKHWAKGETITLRQFKEALRNPDIKVRGVALPPAPQTVWERLGKD